MHAYKALLVFVGLVEATLVVADSSVPQFVETIDTCESLWRDKKYEQLYKYVDELGQKAADDVSIRVLLAWREEQFGGQFEAEAAELRQITNQAVRILCEVNPEFFPRLGKMADDADEMGLLCMEAKQDKEYRRKNDDPRLKPDNKSFGPYLQRCFIDVPFLIPNTSVSLWRRTPKMDIYSKSKTSGKVLRVSDIATKIFAEQSSFCYKKKLLDEYVSSISSVGGAKGLVEKFSDDFVQLNGYCALAILSDNKQEAKQALMEYIEREDPAIGADRAKRMAVWALLRFAHEDRDAEVYLRKLPQLVKPHTPLTKGYLQLAIKHLDEGCRNHSHKSSSKEMSKAMEQSLSSDK